jgi:hypothetical protein
MHLEVYVACTVQTYSYKSVVAKPQGRRPLGCLWEDNLKQILKKDDVKI